MRSLAALALAFATAVPPGYASAQEGGKPDQATPPAYEDRLIDDGALEPDLWDGMTPSRSAAGWPRGLRLDGLWSRVRRNDVTTTQYGAGVGGFLATPQYGAFSFDGLFTNGEDSSIATLWQRDMPFEGGWRASNGLGMLNSPAIDMVRFQPRIFLATSPMLGAVTEWRSPQGMQVVGGLRRARRLLRHLYPGVPAARRTTDQPRHAVAGRWPVVRWHAVRGRQRCHERTATAA